MCIHKHPHTRLLRWRGSRLLCCEVKTCKLLLQEGEIAHKWACRASAIGQLVDVQKDQVAVQRVLVIAFAGALLERGWDEEGNLFDRVALLLVEGEKILPRDVEHRADAQCFYDLPESP